MEAEFSGFAIGRKYLEKKVLNLTLILQAKKWKLARQGDSLAIELLYEAGYALGRLCSMAQNLLDLEKAVLGGGVCVYEFDFLKPGIDRRLMIAVPAFKAWFYSRKQRSAMMHRCLEQLRLHLMQ